MTQALAQPESKVQTFHQHGATEIRVTLLTQQEQDEACACTVGKGPNPKGNPGCQTCRGTGLIKAIKGHRLDLHIVDAESVLAAAKEIQGDKLPPTPAKLFCAIDALVLQVVANCDDVAAALPDGTRLTITAANLADVLAGETFGEMPKA